MKDQRKQDQANPDTRRKYIQTAYPGFPVSNYYCSDFAGICRQIQLALSMGVYCCKYICHINKRFDFPFRINLRTGPEERKC